MIEFNNPAFNKERQESKPLNLEEEIRVVALISDYAKSIFSEDVDLLQRFIWNYENMRHQDSFSNCAHPDFSGFSIDWPESTSIETTQYDFKRKELHVLFRNKKKYLYLDVPETVWNDLIKTDSIGKFINSHVKPNYGTA